MDRFYGRMNGPTSSSYVKGLCGEEMEFYLAIENDKIIEVKYYTEGCDSTRACAAMAASLAVNQTVNKALAISAGQVIKGLAEIPKEHLHCSILAVNALYKAIADYLLKA
ncbi:MAG: iron-sulfur cluster assembly scaffold protein [bacterium]